MHYLSLSILAKFCTRQKSHIQIPGFIAFFPALVPSPSVRTLLVHTFKVPLCLGSTLWHVTKLFVCCVIFSFHFLCVCRCACSFSVSDPSKGSMRSLKKPPNLADLCLWLNYLVYSCRVIPPAGQELQDIPLLWVLASARPPDYRVLLNVVGFEKDLVCGSFCQEFEREFC